MSEIKIERKPDQQRLDNLGVHSRSIWSCEASEFPWTYDAEETCYFLDGDVTVTPDGGVPVTMGIGDLVTFPKGLSCLWEIRQAVKKHYRIS